MTQARIAPGGSSQAIDARVRDALRDALSPEVRAGVVRFDLTAQG